MYASSAPHLGIDVLSWVNDQLRQEIERREALARQSRLLSRLRRAKTAAMVAISGMSLALLRWLEF